MLIVDYIEGILSDVSPVECKI